MQTIPGYPVDFVSAEPCFRVLVDGVEVDAASVSVSSALSSYLPEQVAVGGAITAATGSVEWAEGALSSERSAHPWSPKAFPPKPETPASVELGYDGIYSRALTGVIESASGAVVAGGVESGLIDYFDRLNKQVSLPPLLDRMPPLDVGGTYRQISLHRVYFIDRVLRECGFFATPAREGGCIFSAPLMGSLWAERGMVTAGALAATGGAGSQFNEAPWGQSADFAQGEYVVNSTAGALTSSMRAIFLATKPPTGTNEFSVLWPGEKELRFVADSVSVQVRTNFTGDPVTICSIPWSSMPDAEVFTFTIDPSGVATIHSDTGQTATGTFTRPVEMTQPIDHIRFTSDTAKNGSGFGGLQLAFNANRGPTNFTRTAFLDAPDSGYLIASPAVEGVPASELLKEWAQAECAAMFLDEFGNFRWVTREHLTTGAPVGELTMLDDVVDLEWESSSAHVRSNVVVKHRLNEGGVTTSSYRKITVYQGSGDTIDPGDVIQQFVDVPADEDWIDVDLRANIIDHTDDAPGHVSVFNRGRDTWFGGTLTNEDGSVIDWPRGEISASFEQVSGRAYKYQITTSGLASTERVIQKTMENNTSLFTMYRGYDLPIIRASARIMWRDSQVTGATSGPSTARVLEHDGGWWVQRTVEAQALADWISSLVSSSQPVIRSLRIVPNHTIQLGDLWTVTDPIRTGVTFTVLVVGKSITHGIGTAEQSITCQVVSVELDDPTLAEHDAVWTQPGDTLTLHDQLLAAKTLAQHDAAPLARS